MARERGRSAGAVQDLPGLLGAVMANCQAHKASFEEGSETMRSAARITLSAQNASVLAAPPPASGDDPRSVAVASCLRHAVEEMLPTLARVIGRKCKVEVSFPPSPWKVRAEMGEMHLVLMNLCLNAFEAMPRGGLLRISSINLRLTEALVALPDCVSPGEYAILEVGDQGLGMDAATRARAFEPYFTTRGSGGGIGLGLATVQALVRSRGGAVTVESVPDMGSVFRVYLPRQSEQKEQPAVRLLTPEGASSKTRCLATP